MEESATVWADPPGGGRSQAVLHRGARRIAATNIVLSGFAGEKHLGRGAAIGGSRRRAKMDQKLFSKSVAERRRRGPMHKTTAYWRDRSIGGRTGKSDALGLLLTPHTAARCVWPTGLRRAGCAGKQLQ